MPDPFHIPEKTKSFDYSGAMNVNTSNSAYSTPAVYNWDLQKAITRGYNMSSWVNWAVNGHMRSIAGVEWNVMERNSQNEWHKAKKPKFREAERSLDVPRPGKTRQPDFEFYCSHLYLGGNGLAKKIFKNDIRSPKGKIPFQFWPMLTWKTTPMPDKESDISILNYRYGKGYGSKTYQTDEVLHFMFTNPLDPRWGIGRLQAAAQVVDTDLTAVRWNLGAMNRRAVPGGIVTFDNKINRIQHEEATEWIDDSFSGPDNVGRTLVLGNKAQFTQVERNPIDMDYRGNREFSRDEIIILFGYHPAMVSTNAATFNNMDAARRFVWTEERLFVLAMMAGVLNEGIIPYYTDEVDRYAFVPDFSKITALKEDVSSQTKDFVALVQNRVPPTVAARQVNFDLESFEGDDVSYVNKSWVPTIHQTAPVDATGDPTAELPPEDPTNQKKSNLLIDLNGTLKNRFLELDTLYKQVEEYIS